MDGQTREDQISWCPDLCVAVRCGGIGSHGAWRRLSDPADRTGPARPGPSLLRRSISQYGFPSTIKKLKYIHRPAFPALRIITLMVYMPGSVLLFRFPYRLALSA